MSQPLKCTGKNTNKQPRNLSNYYNSHFWSYACMLEHKNRSIHDWIQWTSPHFIKRTETPK